MRMTRRLALAVVCLSGVSHALVAQDDAQYLPPRGSWETRPAEKVGMRADALAEAVAFAKRHEASAPKDLEEAHQRGFGREPHGESVGPFLVRGPATGLVVRNGYIVAEWGEPNRVDMTFSVTKSFLSTTVGLAVQHGKIQSVDDFVGPSMAPVDLPAGDGEPGVDRNGYGKPDPVRLFQTVHNRKITWDHLLRQTSDWEGTLFGKPDWADRPSRDSRTWRTRARHEPGSVYEYNDVRVNLLALAATNVWRKPIQAVLRDHVMDPIGASPTWRWRGYENSWITVDGSHVQVPSGGGHWGGGMTISAYDQARFGLLTLRRGKWGVQQLMPESWFDAATTPTDANPGYGYMNYFLNRPDADGKKRYPSAPDSAFAHLGAGTNMVYVDREHDLVVVARWIDRARIDDFLRRVLAAVE